MIPALKRFRLQRMKSSLALVALTLWSILVIRGATADEPSPNILLIYVDDLGYNDLECYDAQDPGIKTPNINRLAADGIRFTNYLSACSVCSPSRAAVLTGRYPQRNGLPVCPNDRPEYPDWYQHVGLPQSEITIAELLKPIGYATAAFGKWHLGDADEFAPRQQGFDRYVGRKHNFHVGKAGTWFENETPQDEIMFRDAHQRLTDATIDFMQRQHAAEKPFFVYLAHYLVHGPWSPNQEFCTEQEWASVQKLKGRMNPKALPAMVRELDHHVGCVLDQLASLGIEDDTLVIFASDNGPWLPAGSAYPLSGWKYTTMEGGHRVPAIIRWPKTIPAGQVCDAMVSALDVMPTIAAATGTTLPRDRTYDGYSLLPLLTGQTDQSPREEFLYYNGLTLEAVRRGPWKLHLPRTADQRVYWARHPRKTYLNLDHPVLNHLPDDLSETKDVAARYPDQTSRLQSLADEARQELGDWNRDGTDRADFAYPGDLNEGIKRSRKQAF